MLSIYTEFRVPLCAFQSKGPIYYLTVMWRKIVQKVVPTYEWFLRKPFLTCFPLIGIRNQYCQINLCNYRTNFSVNFVVQISISLPIFLSSILCL